MSGNRNNTPIQEYRGAERLFRLDRDTLIIFVGKEADDLRPFLRIGAGKNPPEGLLGLIENVVLPDTRLWNIGMELEWLDITLHETSENLRYIGSKERIAQLNGYIKGDSEMAISEESQQRLVMHPYDPGTGVVDAPKNRALTTYLKNGNFQVSVSGLKTLDFDSYQRTSYNIDREISQLNKILQQSKVDSDLSGYSFRYAGSHQDQDLPLLWVLNGGTMFLNPPSDLHVKMFQWNMYSDELNNVFSSSPYAPGVIEVVRRKDVLSTPVGVFTPDIEKTNLLKKIYRNAELTVLDDSRTLHSAKNTVFFKSKTGSHGAFSIKHESLKDSQIQIIFPLNGEGKQSRAFDSVRAPHDLEIDLVNSKADLKKVAASNLRLIAPGDIKDKEYDRLRLVSGTYPLLADCDYRFVVEANPGKYVDHFLTFLDGSDFHMPMQRLSALVTSEKLDMEQIRKAIRELRRMKRPVDYFLRNNVHQFLRFMKYTSMYSKVMSDSEKKSFDLLIRRYDCAGLRVRDWFAMKERNPVFSLFVFGGKDTFFLVAEGGESGLIIEFPPEVEMLEGHEKEYKQYLRSTQKAIDKMGLSAQGYTRTLEFMEKLYEQRLDYLKERKRLQGLLNQIELPVQEGDDIAGASWIPVPVRNIWSSVVATFSNIRMPESVVEAYYKVGDYFQATGDFLEDRAGFLGGRRLTWIVPLLLALLIIFFSFFGFGGNGSDKMPPDPVTTENSETPPGEGEPAKPNGEVKVEGNENDSQTRAEKGEPESVAQLETGKKKVSSHGFSEVMKV